MRVVLDVDGVVADFVGGVLDVFNAICYPPVTRDQVREWEMETLLPEAYRPVFFWHCSQPGFCADLAPLPSAVAAIREMRRRGHDVVFATSPWSSETWIPERTAWLERHFGAVEIHHVKDKTGVHGDVFVDDKPEHVIAWHLAHPRAHACLWDAPYNRGSNLRRLHNWPDALAMIEGIKLELFARERVAGWDARGDAVPDAGS